MSQYNKLYTPKDSAVVFIDHQPQMLFGVGGIDRAAYINNVVLLAKAAKEFKVPTVLTAVETEGFSGYVFPQLLDVFPGQEVVERTSMNSWDSEGFRNAVKATGRKNILMTGLWTEVCICWPTIQMLAEGYNIYVVEDCCGATSPVAQEAALSRMVQAGAIRVTTIAALLFDKSHQRVVMLLCGPIALPFQHGCDGCEANGASLNHSGERGLLRDR